MEFDNADWCNRNIFGFEKREFLNWILSSEKWSNMGFFLVMELVFVYLNSTSKSSNNDLIFQVWQ